jgi:hypothetical protein
MLTSPAVYGGTPITVRGTDLVEGSTISLGGAELQNVTLVDETTLTGIPSRAGHLSRGPRKQ